MRWPYGEMFMPNGYSTRAFGFWDVTSIASYPGPLLLHAGYTLVCQETVTLFPWDSHEKWVGLSLLASEREVSSAVAGVAKALFVMDY